MKITLNKSLRSNSMRSEKMIAAKRIKFEKAVSLKILVMQTQNLAKRS